jgi:hypothetical protein
LIESVYLIYTHAHTWVPFDRAAIELIDTHARTHTNTHTHTVAEPLSHVSSAAHDIYI